MPTDTERTEPIRPMPAWCQCGEVATSTGNCPKCDHPDTQAGRETPRRDWREEA